MPIVKSALEQKSHFEKLEEILAAIQAHNTRINAIADATTITGAVAKANFII